MSAIHEIYHDNKWQQITDYKFDKNNTLIAFSLAGKNYIYVGGELSDSENSSITEKINDAANDIASLFKGKKKPEYYGITDSINTSIKRWLTRGKKVGDSALNVAFGDKWDLVFATIDAVSFFKEKKEAGYYDLGETESSTPIITGKIIMYSEKHRTREGN